MHLTASIVLSALLASAPGPYLTPGPGLVPDTVDAELGAPAGAAGCPSPLPVLLEAPFARARGLSPGDSLRVSAAAHGEGCPAHVAGVHRPPPDPARLAVDRPHVLFHLPDLAALADRRREADRFSVRLHDGVDPEVAARELEPLLPGTQVLPTPEVAHRTSLTFRVVERFHRAIGVVTLAAGGVFLACVMFLKIQQRRREVAALRLAGVSRRTLVGWLALEAALVSVLGGILGVGIAHVASGVVNRHYQAVYETSLAFSVLTPDIVWTVLVLAVALGIAVGLAAGGRLLLMDPRTEVGR